MKTGKTETDICTLQGVNIFCPILAKIVTVPNKAYNLEWGTDYYDCAVCTSHGEVTLTVACVCGENHKIIVDEW